jgi:hypothetical protein
VEDGVEGILGLDEGIEEKGVSHWVWNWILKERWCCRLGFEIDFREFGVINEINDFCVL